MSPTTTQLMPPSTSTSTSTLTTSTSTTTTRPAAHSFSPHSRKVLPSASSRGLRKLPPHAASTPNLNKSYLAAGPPSPAAASTSLSAAPSPALQNRLKRIPSSSLLSRNPSTATLTQKSLAAIPDASSNYALDSVLNVSQHTTTTHMAPTPQDVALGDTVDVPGGMVGTVRFVGTVAGKKGTFAGVELHPEFSGRGKNSGDVEGVNYFTTSVPGAGIFLPVNKASRRVSDVNGSLMSSFPVTPTQSNPNGLKAGNQNSTNYTPPTPGLPKFSASIGPGARAPSPTGKKPRTSLPRPDSPVRRTAMTPGPRPSIGAPAKTPARYGSPTNRFAQSVRGTAGDPSKRPNKLDRKLSIGPRSTSALGFDDDSNRNIASGLKRAQTNGSAASMSPKRPGSRAVAVNNEEVEHLQAQLQDRDRQLKEQAATLAEMESSLTELQSLIESPDGPLNGGDNDKDSAQLRLLLREKSEKIAMLTAEFDAHRADFRSTIDTLEMASTETERVYEKRIEELTADLKELESRNLDVDSVASQLKQLEELVQELEEGLEDARRGEAEARGEVEFLRGEVERTRTELRRERERSGSGSPASSRNRGSLGGEKSGPAAAAASTKDLESKEDEIRGLKAIIHSLSRDSIPSAETRRMSMGHGRSSTLFSNEALDNKIARDNLERQVAELQSLLDKRSSKQEELERELDHMRRASLQQGSANGQAHRSSLRDSRDTVVLASAAAAEEAAAAAAASRATNNDNRGSGLHRGDIPDVPESDDHSTVTENSTLWCEICETGGHDILTCTNMFGSENAHGSTGGQTAGNNASAAAVKPDGSYSRNNDAYHGGGSSGNRNLTPASAVTGHDRPAPLSPRKRTVSPAPPTKVMPNPMESGPVAGKESGIMDPEKWCAVCERDGHDSVDCPFEDAF